MLGLQKNYKVAFVFAGLIATLVTIGFCFLLPKFQKYQANIVSTEIIPNERYVFDDLDGDNLSEKIRYIPDFEGTSAIIVEKNDKMLYQHNFSGQFLNTNFPIIHDYNNDKLKEIYLFTLRNDSWLCIL